MKREKVIILGLLVIIIILLGGNINFILEKNSILKSNKQIIKEMNESTQVTDLNNQINALNTEHTNYMNYIQTCKTQIATALTTEGVTTSNQETLETMAENISKVLQARTSDATATADNITEGKTAYVNGELIIGTGEDNKLNYENGQSNAKTYAIKFSSYSSRTLASVNISSYYENYTQLTNSNIIVQMGYMQDEQSESGGSRQLSYSYNPSTGVVTISCAGELLNPCNGTIFIIENAPTYLN